MVQTVLRILVIGAIFFFVGVAGAAAYFAYLPGPASAPAFFDEFNSSGTTRAFWHANSYGASFAVHGSSLLMSGSQLELDRRIQTDPKKTIVFAKVSGIDFHKFAIGFGVYHAGTVGIEFDNDGVKCGRGTEHGWKIDYLRAWTKPPVGQWFYLELDVTNPYPGAKKVTPEMKKGSTITCAVYDSTGHLVVRDVATNPPSNTQYVALDEAYLRMWDGNNKYRVDWFYAGPPSGNPMARSLRGA